MPRNIDAEYQTTVNDVIVSIEKVLPLLKQKNELLEKEIQLNNDEIHQLERQKQTLLQEAKDL